MHASHQLQRGLFSGALAASRPHAPTRLPQASVQPQRSSDQAQEQNHAVPQQQRNVPGPQAAAIPKPVPGTRREQYAEPSQFGASISTLLLGAALLSERLNGVGFVQAIELHEQRFHPLLLAAVAGLALASVWPEKVRPAGAPKKTLEFRLREVAGRFAHGGLAGVLLGEMLTGKGILTLLDVETGVEALSDIEGAAVFMVLLVLTGNGSSTSKCNSSWDNSWDD